jgi:uncharacterized protein YfaS (alpha-2-macroglobulin family)
MKRLCRLLPALTLVTALVCACSVSGPTALHPGGAGSRTPGGMVAIPAAYTPGSDDPQTDQKSQPFQMSDSGPSGTVPHENLEGGVWVLFNKPVVPLARLAKPMTASSVLSITPRVEGTFRWYGSRLLSFEPKGQLAPATEYTVSISKSVRSLEGETITGDTDFTFRTEPLGIVSLSPQGSDVIPEASKEIVITFNFPVDLATIVPFIRLEADGAQVRFSASRTVVRDRSQLGPYENTGRMVSLTPAADLPRDADIRVVVRAGAKPRPENYGTSADLTAGFHTLVPLALETSEISMSGPSVNAILRFNHELADDSVPGNIKVPFKGYSLDSHLEISGSWVYVSDLPAPFESSFDMQLLKGITDVYGQTLGQDQVTTLRVGRAATYVSFRASGQKILESQFPPRVAVEFQNVDSGKFGIGILKEPFIQKPGTANKRLDIRRVPENTRHFELFDLSPYLNKDRKGAAWLSWVFSGRFDETDDTSQEVKDDLEVQVTDIGASVHIADNSLVVVAGSLSTGLPLSDATVMLRKGAQRLATGTTDAAGLAALALPPGVLMSAFRGHEEDALVEITKGTDRLVLRPSDMPSLAWNSSEPYRAEVPRPLTYIWSDRGIYRPGETVSFAGIDQNLTLGKLAPVTGKYRIDLKTGSEDAAPVATFSGTTSRSGSFFGQVTLPRDVEPGDWFLSFSRTQGKEQGTGQAWVKIANFRRVTFSVDLSLPDTRADMGGTLSATFAGKYLAGGNVAQGKWSWFWTRREQWYQPPGDDLAPYSFGAVTRPYPEDLGSQSGSLSGAGTVTATQALADGDKGRVYDYEIAATVEDIDRQAISKRDSRLVFSSDQLLGALISSSPKADDSLYFVQKDAPFALKVVSVDPDGKPYPSGNVQGRLIRDEWKLVRERGVGGVIDTHYEQEETTEKEFTVRPDRPFGSIQLSTQKAGSYAIELSGKDARGRESFTRISFYSTGADFIRWSSTDERQIEIVPDKKIYEPGDTARLLIKSPVAKGVFLVSVEREGIIEKRAVTLEGSAPTIDIPVKEGYLPHFYVFVATSQPRTKPPADGPDSPDFGKPRGYSGLIEIPVRTGSRLIHVDLTSAKPTYLPGTQASVTVKATWRGKPLAGAEVALVAADRGVLDLIDYHIQSPLDFFYDYGNFPDRVAHYESRDLLIDPVTWKARDLPGGDEKGEAAPETSGGVKVRKDFNPTAVFRAGLVTGKDGTVTVTFKLPDSLTTFRTTAVLARGELFGLGEGSFQVQNPINVRTALPRRLRVGDSATAGVVVTNLDARPRSVAISLSAADPLKITGPARRTAQLAPGASAEVAFNLQAPKEGVARLAFDVDSDILRERLEDQLTVAADHVNEAFTIIGKTTNAAREAIVVPPAFLGAPEEGLYLTLDSTIASNLIGAIRFLEIYPYDCLEQVTSKMFARVLFPRLSSEKADLTTLERFANPDGGFSYWDNPAPRRSNYYVSLRVAHLLALAADQGFDIPEKLDTDALLEYLQKRYDSPFMDAYMRSYAVYVFSLYGRKEKAKADALAAQGDRIGIFGYGFLGLAYAKMGDTRSAARILTRMKSFVRVGTRTVTLVGTVNDWFWYGGNIQAKALLLMLYAQLQPDSQLVLGLANDLLAANSGGYWGNTSNAGWVLQAFAEMITQNKEASADFTAQVKLGDSTVAQRAFKGLSKAPYKKQITAAELTGAAPRQPGAQVPLMFSVDGTGTLYYTAELRYAIASPEVDARDEGIGIAAEIQDQNGKAVDGTALALGQVYRMKLVFYSSRDRTFVALRAPIPSGAEPIDGSLVTSQIVKQPRQDASADNGDNGDNADSGDEEAPPSDYTSRIYDSEVRFFFDQLDRGKHEVSFLFRTTTPGSFPTPPVQAELMYQPEVFGRTAGSVYTIGK